MPEAVAGVAADGLVELLRRGDVRDPEPEVVDLAALAHRAVVDRLGAVAVRIEEEGSVVVVPVFRPHARLAVAPEPSAGAGRQRLVDCLADGATKAMCSLRVTGLPGLQPESEKSSHSPKSSSELVRSIPSVGSTRS